MTLDANSSAGKGSRSPRSKSAGSSDSTTNVYRGKINQLDLSASNRLIEAAMERAVSLVKAVETAAANALSAGIEARQREVLY